MEWRTRITEMLGIQYPIIQGAYGGFGTSAIAAPVSAAGGLGIITAGALKTPEKLQEDIRRARSMTDKPIGVNLSVGMCPQIDEMREVCIEETIPVVETAVFRADDHGKRLQAAGIKWIHKVATVEHAIVTARQGVDAVVIVGLEGTGFKSVKQVPTMLTLALALKQIQIPVIAAGCIGDGRTFLAALSMGAEAVYIGTAFMATKECPIPDKHKQMLVDIDMNDPKVKDRALVPPKPEEVDRIMKLRGKIPESEWLQKLERVLVKESPDEAPDELDTEEVLRIAPGSLAVGLINRIPTVKEFIDEIITEAEETLKSRKFLAPRS
ncbi:MAG: nitronate monooxygenase [Candidatus Tectomicrobia bacterium]|uniref:Nitronate monooxygenase n=1 Tax=Tectimicrobiota bacterium TaxID=2528274 RepID=A0A932CMS5_UNCTE|nr:nitronate monooxygenase [Candidatus Tectomicrobia bacterium]